MLPFAFWFCLYTNDIRRSIWPLIKQQIQLNVVLQFLFMNGFSVGYTNELVKHSIDSGCGVHKAAKTEILRNQVKYENKQSCFQSTDVCQDSSIYQKQFVSFALMIYQYIIFLNFPIEHVRFAFPLFSLFAQDNCCISNLWKTHSTNVATNFHIFLISIMCRK